MHFGRNEALNQRQIWGIPHFTSFCPHSFIHYKGTKIVNVAIRQRKLCPSDGIGSASVESKLATSQATEVVRSNPYAGRFCRICQCQVIEDF